MRRYPDRRTSLFRRTTLHIKVMRKSRLLLNWRIPLRFLRWICVSVYLCKPMRTFLRFVLALYCWSSLICNSKRETNWNNTREKIRPQLLKSILHYLRRIARSCCAFFLSGNQKLLSYIEVRFDPGKHGMQICIFWMVAFFTFVHSLHTAREWMKGVRACQLMSVCGAVYFTVRSNVAAISHAYCQQT